MATGLLTREAPPWRSIKLTPTHSHRPALGNEDLQERETEGGNQCGSHAGGLGVSVLGRSCGGTAARDPFPNRARRLQTVPVWVISVCTWKRTWISEAANTNGMPQKVKGLVRLVCSLARLCPSALGIDCVDSREDGVCTLYRVDR